MAEETKKISFGFSKLKKQNNLIKPIEAEKKEVEYVDSFDGTKGKFSYKGNVRSDEPTKKELIIPLIGTKTVLEVIRSKLEEKKEKIKEGENNEIRNSEIKPDEVENISQANPVKNEPKTNAKTKELSIDDLAAKEIINDLQNNTVEEKNDSSTIVIKQPSKVVDGKDTIIDYESIPVTDFGLAMLRGMGWTPQTGIGKEQRIVQVVTPKLRPKGLGLGADKVLTQKSSQDSDLTINIKSYVKFVGGPNKGNYGQIEAMDDDNARTLVKLASGGIVSVPEVYLVPISKKDYEKNNRVLNPTKYEDYKEKSDKNQPRPNVEQVRERVASESSKNCTSNRHRKEKYEGHESSREGRKKETEQSDSSDDRRRACSSSSSAERDSERRSKKKHGRNVSRDRKRKKSKKKKRNKHSSERESDSSDRGKHRRDVSFKNGSRKSRSKNGSYR